MGWFLLKHIFSTILWIINITRLSNQEKDLEILRRTQDGLLRAIKGGKYSGGVIAYGYRINPETTRLEIEETEAQSVRMMFGWCVDERRSCVKIAERLNALGIPTRYQIDGRRLRRGKRAPENTDGI